MGSALGLAGPARAQSLRGSSASLDRQNEQAHLHDFTYLRQPGQVRRFVDAGLLVPVEGNRDYHVEGASFDVARPEVVLFVERLGAQFHRSCGEPLVVTSLTRPTSGQPPNASRRSVHPTGMAVDLRVPAVRRCRTWLESTLLSLERSAVLEATREVNPPHYHVALFPEEYAAYVARITGRRPPVPSVTAAQPDVALAHGEAPGGELVRSGVLVPVRAPRGEPGLVDPIDAAEAETPHGGAGNETPAEMHTIEPGETLWGVAQGYGVSVRALQEANGLDSSRVLAGQTLVIPTGSPD